MALPQVASLTTFVVASTVTATIGGVVDGNGALLGTVDTLGSTVDTLGSTVNTTLATTSTVGSIVGSTGGTVNHVLSGLGL